MKYTSKNKWILISLVASLAIKICAIFLLKSYESHDDYEYGLIARALISGEGYSINSFGGPYESTSNFAPFYAFFLAFFYNLGINNVTFFFIHLFQSIISTLTGLIIYQTGKTVFNEKVGFLAFLGVLFYPPLIAYSLRICTIVFFIFFTALTLLYICKVKREPTLKNQVICGILMGITALAEPNILPFLPFSILWLFFNSKEQPLIKCKRLLTITLFCTLVILPWTVRNYLILDRIILIKSTVGFNLWMGNNPSATGTFYLANGDLFQKADLALEAMDPTQTNSTLALDDMYFRSAVSFIKDHPMQTVKLSFTKLFYYWWYPDEILLSPQAARLMKLMKIPYGILLISSILCIWIFRSKIKEIDLLIMLFLSFSLIHAVFVVGHPRYRTPLEIYLILLASQSVFFIKEKFSPLNK